MRRWLMILPPLAAAILLPAVIRAQARRPVPVRATERIAREVQHEILMLPYYGVFDAISYEVNGYSVTLTGWVTRPTLRSDAERAVKSIEGVEAVQNQIEVLPLSPNDDRLRLALYRAIYRSTLERYAIRSIAPIRIIVKNGNVTLEGLVDSALDKTLAVNLAKGVPGVFSVADRLEVAPTK